NLLIISENFTEFISRTSVSFSKHPFSANRIHVSISLTESIILSDNIVQATAPLCWDWKSLRISDTLCDIFFKVPERSFFNSEFDGSVQTELEFTRKSCIMPLRSISLSGNCFLQLSKIRDEHFSCSSIKSLHLG
ncbi:hypothetical protein MXB_4181, partial [Myxobolus squamalis]